MPRIPIDEQTLIRRIHTRLRPLTACGSGRPGQDPGKGSVVLFLLGMGRVRGRTVPCLILNKRSSRVAQPGDLCCPGGGIDPVRDRILARLLEFPGSPLRSLEAGETRTERRSLATPFATALREGFEEMQLNPFRVRLLGRLPRQHLVMFKRTIDPMVSWVSGQQRFHPNWEVERIVSVPLEALLSPAGYGVYRVRMDIPSGTGKRSVWQDFPGFMHREHPGAREMLWGATHRMVMDFLGLVFDASPPEADTLPVFYGALGPEYLRIPNKPSSGTRNPRHP